MRRGLAIAFATIMVVSMVAVPFGAAVGAVGASSGPSGMVALGSGQISEDLPEDTDAPIRADDLEGAVYAGDHADSLEVIVTTPERADDHLENANVLADDDVAIVLSDDEVHEGREVAVDADVLEAGVGYLPSVAYGVHSSGEEWHSEIDVESGVAIFEVPEFSSNSVTFSGGIELTGTEAASGTSYAYELDSLDGISDFEIDLEGARETEERSVSSTTSDGTISVEPRGTSPPEDAVMTIEGVRDTEARSTSAMASDGDSFNVDVGGSTDAKDGSVSFTGVVDPISETISGTGSSSVNLDGNQEASGTLSISYNTPDYTHSSDMEESGAYSSSDTEYVSTDELGFESISGFDYDVTKSGYDEGDYTVDVRDPDGNSLDFPNADISDYDEIQIYLHTSNSMSQHYVRLNSVTIYGEIPEDLTVEGDHGSEFSETFGTTDSGSEEITVDSDLESIDQSTSNGLENDIDWTFDYSSEYRTKDPSVVIDGSTVSHSGTLDDGETVTETISPSEGSHTADVSTEHEVDVDVEWTDVYQSENPQLDLAGESIFNSGVLEEGETVSEPVDLETAETYSGEISSDGPVTARVEWVDVSRRSTRL